MKRFLDQVGILEKLWVLDLTEPGSNRGYESEENIESFWLNIWTGASRYVRSKQSTSTEPKTHITLRVNNERAGNTAKNRPSPHG